MGALMDLDMISANVRRVIRLRTFLHCTHLTRMHAHMLYTHKRLHIMIKRT